MSAENFPAANSEQTRDRQYYIHALGIMDEVSYILFQEEAAPQIKKVMRLANSLTYSSTPERVIKDAEDLTYNAGVKYPARVLKQAEKITADTAPVRAVEIAEEITLETGEALPKAVLSAAEKILKGIKTGTEQASAHKGYPPV